MSNPSATEQPAPKPGREVVKDHLVALISARNLNFGTKDYIQADIEARAERGKQTYGTHLMTHNGRDAVMDWYQESLDGCMYAMQLFLETNNHEVYRMLLKQIEIATQLKSIMEARN